MKLINEAEENKRMVFWFAYRYLYKNRHLLEQSKYNDLFKMMNDFFFRLYWQKSIEDTKSLIENLFRFESERHITINLDVIDQLVEQYEKNPFVLM